VIGEDREIEREAGLALLVGEMPGVRIHPFHIARQDWRQLLTSSESLVERLGYGEETRALIGFGDPFTTPVNQFFQALDANCPAAPLVGGMASSARTEGENVLFRNDQAFDEGFVGVSLSGPVEVDTIVSQGCRGIGKPMVITKAKENLIEQLGGKPALGVVQEIVSAMSESERELLQNGLLVGRAISEYRDRFGRADFLIRNVMGVNQETGAVAVADYMKVGQTIQFHVRDASTADEDLSLMLEAQKLSDAPAGGLLFSCNGRGTRLFDAPCHDINAAHRAMAATPIAGFFAAGEIGPVGGKNFIHGHTASFALFRPQK
jgi:small ligand-binding sensory domain FIST